MILRPIREQDILPVVDLILRNWDEIMSRCHSPEIVAKYRAEVTPGSIRVQMQWKEIFVVDAAQPDSADEVTWMTLEM